MTRHTPSFADTIYLGSAYNQGYQSGQRGVELSHVYFYNLGAVLTADADGILDDATATDSAQVVTTFLQDTMDVPRALTATGTTGSDHVITVTGTDAYGNVMKENLTLSGVNVIAGVKAFKTITQVDVAAGAAGDTYDLGWGDVLGLPFYIDAQQKLILYASNGIEDISAFVAGVTTDPATATTGDVRGTISPTTSPDSSVTFGVWMVVDHTTNAGAFGVAQYSG